jgi:hypothetical protein
LADDRCDDSGVIVMRRCLFVFCVGGLFFLLAPAGAENACASSQGAGFSSLSDLTKAFSEQMASVTQERKVFVEREYIRDARTGEVWAFSGCLQHELESSLSSRGFMLAPDPADAAFLLGATYQREGDRVRIFFRSHGTDEIYRQTRDYEIPVDRIPQEACALKETLEGKAAKLVQDVKPFSINRSRVYIKPVREGHKGFVSDFSRSFMARLRVAMVQFWQGTEIIDERPILEGLTQSRGILEKAKEVEDLKNWEAVCTDADTVLGGVYFVEGDRVLVALTLKNLKGRLFGSAKCQIPTSIIQASLDNPEAVVLTDAGDVAVREKESIVRILTDLGGDFPVYFEGDVIRLFVQVKKPLHIRVFNITPTGTVNRLYPPAFPPSDARFEPGRLYPLPDEAHPFEFMVLPPFGMDLIKVFASSTPLPVPEISSSMPVRSFHGSVRKTEAERINIQQALAREKAIHPLDLVDYYRGIAAQKGVSLYEDEVMVETRRKKGGP